jgi:hypothetical protein
LFTIRNFIFYVLITNNRQKQWFCHPQMADFKAWSHGVRRGNCPTQKANPRSFVSDGASSQYKNCKNFLNLCYHNEDFGIKAEWHFFATGGPVKCLVARASLQAITVNHVLCAKELFLWAKANISGIEMLFVSADEIERCGMVLKPCLDNTKTIPGTRSHHSFVPVSSNVLQMRRISAHQEGTSVKVACPTQTQQPFSFTPDQYVAAVYDRVWYLGSVVDVSHENEDVLMNFIMPLWARFM